MGSHFEKALLVFFASCVLSSCGIGKGAAPVAGWQILHDESESRRDVMESGGWKDIIIPSTFKLPGAPDMKLHYAWLRGKADITGDPSRYYGLTTGRVYFQESTYVNGQFIGPGKPFHLGIMVQGRNHVLPANLLRQGSNDVYIRLGVYGGEYGGITSGVYFRENNDFNITLLLSNFLYIHFPIEVMTVAFVVVFILMVFYVWNRREIYHLMNSLAILTYILLMSSFMFLYRFLDFPAITCIQLSIIPLFAIVLVLIIESLYGMYLTFVNRVVIPSLIGLIALICAQVYFFRLPVIGKVQAVVMPLLCIAVMMPLTVRLLLRLNAIKPDRFKMYTMMIIIVGGNLITLAELIMGHFAMGPSLILSMVSTPFFLLIFTVFYAREQMRKNMLLDIIYKNLSQQKTPINEESRGKLDRVVEFIKENFKSDLSREGLAAAVDLNPNYMSTLFKKYTGEKINDYINRLRIEEAMRQLQDKDVRVIEVAFSVGFESLTTFNRVFKSITGRTPTEYRDNT